VAVAVASHSLIGMTTTTPQMSRVAAQRQQLRKVTRFKLRGVDQTATSTACVINLASRTVTPTASTTNACNHLHPTCLGLRAILPLLANDVPCMCRKEHLPKGATLSVESRLPMHWPGRYAVFDALRMLNKASLVFCRVQHTHRRHAEEPVSVALAGI